MKGLRKVSKPKAGGRRFKGRKDEAHLETVRRQTCLIRGKRCTLTVWRRVDGDRFKTPHEEEFIHVCWWDPKGNDPHHTVKKSKGGHDGTTVPLCRLAHNEAELLSNDEFLARWGVDLDAEGARRMAEYQRKKASGE